MRSRALGCFVLALTLLVPASCGKKGDPFLPRESTSARVGDLYGVWEGGYIELEGSVADSSGPDSAITGARVLYAVYPLAEAPCDGCPIEYQGFHTFGSEAVREGRFFCKIPGAVKDNVYYFEVRLTGAKGGFGPPSNQAKVVVE